MRVLTEANAKVIEEVVLAHYQELKYQCRQSKSLRLANKERLLYIAIRQLTTKVNKNGKATSKQK